MNSELEIDDVAVGERLQRVREILKLSKRDFAAAAGLKEQVYGPFETGKRRLSLNAALRLRERYDLTFEFMYFGKTQDLPHRIAKEL